MSNLSVDPKDADHVLRLGTDADFETLRRILADASFDDQTLCRLLGMDDMSDLGRVDWETRSAALEGKLRACVEFFVRGLVQVESELVTALGEPAVAAIKSLGLFHSLSSAPTKCFCPVWLYPVDGFLIVSDRHDNPDVDAYVPPADVVFPAIYAGTLRFLRLLPDAENKEALDLCGGTGIAAFRLARSARHAATSDLTERSAHFAAFNARLNNIAVESLCGDLYAPVGERKFDLITAHPPFVPATGPNMVYRDAGETGEDVTRAIVAGLPNHLRPGGRGVILCAVRDTQEQGIETRARDWLGEAAGDFDVIFALEKVLSVDEVVDTLRKRGQNLTKVAAAELRQRLLAASTRRFVYGALLIERFADGFRGKPGRVRMSMDTGIRDFDHLRRIRRARNEPGFENWLTDQKPRLAAELELKARHIVRQGELVPAEFVFSVEKPLPTALRTDGFVVPLIARLNGQFSVRQVYDYAMQNNELPAGFPLDGYVGLVASMIEEGLLQVDLAN